MRIEDFLNEQYFEASQGIKNFEDVIGAEEIRELNVILQYSDRAKAVLTVLITSLVYKSLHPNQDIRKHQISIIGGYSGRTFDSQYITPFLKSNNFPAMAESGWLTRSLEQKVPYDKNYPGAIRPDILKSAFLTLINNIENGANPTLYFSYILHKLIIQRNEQAVSLAKPTTLSIHSILNLLDQHFNAKYNAKGASRLPVLAIYAAYQCLTTEIKRYSDKKILSLESHTTADFRSGRIGDIDIVDLENRAFEAVEIKHGIAITLQIVKNAYSKLQTTAVSRYYLLSTVSQDNKNELEAIESEIQKIKNVHGCQVIVNGVLPTLIGP